jgi:hypothetical protein
MGNSTDFECPACPGRSSPASWAPHHTASDSNGTQGAWAPLCLAFEFPDCCTERERELFFRITQVLVTLNYTYPLSLKASIPRVVEKVLVLYSILSYLLFQLFMQTMLLTDCLT